MFQALYNRKTESLNGVWKYRIDQNDVGVRQSYYLSNGEEDVWKPIDVPHNWYLTEEIGDYFGTIWYTRKFRVPGEMKGQRLFLSFEGVDYIEAAVKLGCRRVVASCMDEGGTKRQGKERRKPLEELLRELENLAPYAEEEDVLLCLENHCHNVLAGPEDYRYVLDRMDSSHVGICLDGGHLEAAGESVGAFIDAFAPRINHLHLKENRRFGEKTFCRFGSGGTDNEAMIREMLRKGYAGYMSVELSPEVGEWGEFVPFTDEDRIKPLAMFSKYEST